MFDHVFSLPQIAVSKHHTANMTMGSPPPNNPNNDSNSGVHAKEEALRPRVSGENENGEVDMINLQDNGLVVVMFLMSVAGWMLRERCIC